MKPVKSVRPEDLGIGKLFERVRDAVIVADAETQEIVLWNPAATNIFGYSPSEALELRVEDLVPGHLRAHHRAGMSHYAQTGHGTYIDSQRLLDLPSLTKDGEEIRIELSLNPIEPPDGEEGSGPFVLAIIRDITERRRGEEALREAEALFHSVFDNASIGMAVTGPDARLLRVNPALCEILGYSEEELLGTELRDITHPADLAVSTEYFHKAIEGEIDTYLLEKRYVGVRGRVVWISLNTSLVRDSERRPLYFVDHIQDITRRKQAEEEIRHLNESLEKRVAERTSQLAEREVRLRKLLGKLVVAQEEERRRVAYEVHDGLAQMIVAVQQHLQAFAKQHAPDPVQGKGSLEWNLALIQQTVEEARRVIGGLRPTALDDFGLAAAIRLQVETLRSEGWEITYDESLGDERLSATLETALYRVAQEALTNVRKHAGTTRVRLSLGRLGQEVRLRVRDRGRGSSRTEMVSGGGPGERVGISGMEERIALLGGAFRVLSRPGAGTLVVARVPLAESGEDLGYG